MGSGAIVARYFSDSTSSLITLLTGFFQSSPCRALAPPKMVRTNQPRPMNGSNHPKRSRPVTPPNMATSTNAIEEINWKLNDLAASLRAYVPGVDSA